MRCPYRKAIIKNKRTPLHQSHSVPTPATRTPATHTPAPPAVAAPSLQAAAPAQPDTELYDAGRLPTQMPGCTNSNCAAQLQKITDAFNALCEAIANMHAAHGQPTDIRPTAEHPEIRSRSRRRRSRRNRRPPSKSTPRNTNNRTLRTPSCSPINSTRNQSRSRSPNFRRINRSRSDTSQTYDADCSDASASNTQTQKRPRSSPDNSSIASSTDDLPTKRQQTEHITTP